MRGSGGRVYDNAGYTESMIYDDTTPPADSPPPETHPPAPEVPEGKSLPEAKKVEAGGHSGYDKRIFKGHRRK